MPKVALYNMEGTQIGEVELRDDIFGVEVNEAVLFDTVQMILANRRRGTASTKTRAEVRGGGRKPWRQKGTGRARAGSIRSPLWRGGGIVFGPKPRNYGYSLPKKVRRLALKSALSAKVEDGNLIVLDALRFEQPKTKKMVEVLEALKIDQKALVVTADNNDNVEKSARNIPGVTPITVDRLNVYDILAHDKMVITQEAVAKVEEVLG
ncbi:50S ribosomal protein L4 [Calderihabitans maritimus]|uniref:Large ribosomal subunit protein uL4 n=1 Tax=Calderihabitans maritimus TaxID=1246530 RepID=A0A1Z5HN16_9FIRM|nr:50S ribosomal protein L4 [Calderihabitans maritimus]GAW90909.1 50S ribosomal protein L4/L1e [Calderihabitans maritimus]